MRNKVKRIGNILIRTIKKTGYFCVFILPVLLLKVRAGITYGESKTITQFYYSAAVYRKNFWYAFRVFFLLFFRIMWNDFIPDYALFPDRFYRQKKTDRSMGRWQGIDPLIKTAAEGVSDTPDIKYFSIGREAIFHALQSNRFERKVALLPIFTCFTVLDPFLQDGWKLCFYRYNIDLTIDSESFKDEFEREKPAFCIFQPLCGMGFLPAESSLIDYAHENGCMTMVDQTQDIYAPRNHQSVDYYCGSLRKWYAFPDGAFLHSEHSRMAQCDALKENNIYRTAMGLCMFAAHLRDTYQNPFFTYLCNFMWTFSVSYIGGTSIEAHTMSDYSRKVLAQQDEAANAKRRTENFRYIYQSIDGMETVRPAFERIERLTNAPLSFPVYAQDRAALVKHLTANGIITQVLWGRPPYIRDCVEQDETTNYIYDHIISLPCDQRYSVEDMQRMIDAIRDFEQKA